MLQPIKNVNTNKKSKKPNDKVDKAKKLNINRINS